MVSTGYKISALVLTVILTVTQIAVISYQIIPQYWCRNNKNATGKGGDYKCFGQSHHGPLQAIYDHNVPCAVCYASTRVAVTMIPAKTQCPSNWTLEYSGYLMSDYHGYTTTMYECVDKNPDSVPGSAANTNGALFHYVEANCNGMLCPSYDPQKELI